MAQASIEAWVSKDQASVSVKSVRFEPPPQPTLEVAVALPKGKRAEELANQLCQLGVNRLIPLLTARSSVKPGPGKIEKLKKQVIEATKQCGRPHLMAIDEPANFNDLIQNASLWTLIADPSAPDLPMKWATIEYSERVLILIGPEGGWTEDELDAAQLANAIPWSMGRNTLRIETAAAAAAAIVRYLTAPDAMGANR